MAFYAIMGIQLFGRMDYRCVTEGTDPNNVTINDLMIPDAMCSKPGYGGYQCPPNMECMNLNLNAKTEGFYGHSVFTVYLAASEEGWVYVLYDCLDSLPTYLAIMYFITLIFFLAWLVKNVFIAVITETFAEIRVQFSEMWTKTEVVVDDDFKQYLRSTGFQCCIVGFVLANAIINASFVHYHDETDAPRRVTYYYIEVNKVICCFNRSFQLGFTIAFNIECVIKILCYGFRAFWKRNIYKFELVLCIGSSLNCIPYFYDRYVFTYFQVFRLLRLIKASPMLEDFVYKQIITQEGWPELVVDVLRMTDDRMVPFVAVYFVAYHLFVTLITSMRTTLPWRLRVFERFPTRPQMVRLRRVDSDFTVPRMRDSFTHQFVVGCEESLNLPVEELGNRKVILKSMSHYLHHHRQPILTRHVGQLTMRTSLQANSVNQSKRESFMATRARHMSLFETMTENGDVMRSGHGGDNSARRDLKQGEIDIRALQHKQQLAEMTRNRIEEEMRENHPFFDRPLFMIGRDSKLRRFCRRWVHARYQSGADSANIKTQRQHKQFHSLLGLMPYIDWTMVIVTLISCVSMLFESPWPTTGENLVMNNFYLQTSLIFLFTMPKHVEINSIAQFLMICRAMRPLRIYTLVPHIRRVVVELFRGFKEILLVTIFMIVIMFIFGSFGVQSVGGKLAACNDLEVTTRENCTGYFYSKLYVTRMQVTGKDDDEMHPKILVPRVWTNPRNFNFDHIGHAMLALFETLSYKGWNVVRDVLLARQGPWAVVFIHIYVFIGCMIGLTLFVGVGTALLTVDQRRWHDLKARLKMAQPLHVPPKPAESAVLRRRLYELTMSRTFNKLFAFLVLLNSCTLLVPWNVEEEDEMHQFLYFLTALSAVLNILFAIEVCWFWQSRRNRIDLLITALGCLWVAVHFFVALPASVVGGETRLKKFTYTFGYMVVILRFFTIAGRNNTLKMLMLTVVMSMFRSLFIIAAMALLVLFYAYTGVILFGMVRYGQAVSKHVNFRSGSEALVVLFRSLTGEDWNDIMHDMSQSTFCHRKPGANYWETDCGNQYGAIIYFCSFYLIITYIVRNLLVAVIIENFSLFYSSEEDALLSYSDIRNFQLVWNAVDTDQRGVIPVRRVKFLLRLLKGRLEVDPTKDRLLFKHMVYEMEKLHNGDDVSFHDVLYMLSYRSVDIRKSLQLEELLEREELEYIIEEEVAKQTIKLWLECCLRKIRCPDRGFDPTARKTKLSGGSPQPKQRLFRRMGTNDQLLATAADSIDDDLTSDRETPAKKAIEDYTNQEMNILQEAAKRFLSSTGAPPKKMSVRSVNSTKDAPPVLYYANTMINHGNEQQTQQQNATTGAQTRVNTQEEPQKVLQLSARELPDLEELYEDMGTYNLSSSGNGQQLFDLDDQLLHRSPTSDSSQFRATSPINRLNVGQRTPRRKVSSVLAFPQLSTNPTTAAICLFYQSEPLNNAVNDIKNWWINNMNAADEFSENSGAR
ncbi:Four domain-type voltage-gated ion channel alpha-1 subunit [Aphelenchoides besseyi]|nr:Four domain-type voltage-gated ion channel alpha-1 subunit [Aphelenchoides besseyi]